MTTRRGAPGLPRSATPDQVIDNANEMLRGTLNVTADLTLAENVATTVITDPRLHAESFIQFMARTESAKNAFFAGLKVTDQTKGAATVHHAISAATDQTFKILIMGS